MLRFSDDEAAALVAGTYDPPALGRLRAGVQRCLNAERRRRVVWLAGWRPLSRHVWGERSLALAQFARAEGCWGPVPPPLASSRLAGAPPAETCPVCFDDYDDPFDRSPIRSTARLLLASVGRVRWPCVPTGSAAPVTRSLRPQLILPAPSAARPVALTLTVTFSRHICRAPCGPGGEGALWKGPPARCCLPNCLGFSTLCCVCSLVVG